MNTQITQDILSIIEHIHQMRDRRTLIAAHVGHPGLKECFSDGKNPFTLENLTLRGA